MRAPVTWVRCPFYSPRLATAAAALANATAKNAHLMLMSQTPFYPASNGHYLWAIHPDMKIWPLSRVGP